MSHCSQYGPASQLAEVGFEQKINGIAKMSTVQGITIKHQQQDHQETQELS